jgi:uncharacterized membrane protein YhdT
MRKKFGVYFGGVIAYILIILYSCTLIYVIQRVCLSGDSKVEVSSGLTYVLTTIGGLVSALVLARLTITPPGDNPGTMDFSQDPKETALAEKLTLGYMTIWLLAGLAALVIGTIIFPGVNSTLSDIGTTWLGLAVTSVYVYFGLNKP